LPFADVKKRWSLCFIPKSFATRAEIETVIFKYIEMLAVGVLFLEGNVEV
jgi:hypothetical protein